MAFVRHVSRSCAGLACLLLGLGLGLPMQPAHAAQPVPGIAHARPAAAKPFEASRLADLARPDTLIVIRHANAPGIGDPPGFDLDKCATQRNLDDRGREQARALGVAWKNAGIFPTRIFTSAWCRCVDTALQLKMGPVAMLAELNSIWEKGDDRASQTAELKDFIHRLDPRGGPYVMVTHQVNLAALAGETVDSGTGVVMQVGRSEGMKFLPLPKD